MGDRAAWLARFDAARADAAAILRLEPGVTGTWLGGSLLVRCAELSDRLANLLVIALPDARFEVSADGNFYLPGRRLPAGRVPEASWAPPDAFFTPRCDPAAFPAAPVPAVVLCLVRSSMALRRATALLTTADVFSTWATVSRPTASLP